MIHKTTRRLRRQPNPGNEDAAVNGPWIRRRRYSWKRLHEDVGGRGDYALPFAAKVCLPPSCVYARRPSITAREVDRRSRMIYLMLSPTSLSQHLLYGRGSTIVVLQGLFRGRCMGLPVTQQTRTRFRTDPPGALRGPLRGA